MDLSKVVKEQRNTSHSKKVVHGGLSQLHSWFRQFSISDVRDRMTLKHVMLNTPPTPTRRNCRVESRRRRRCVLGLTYDNHNTCSLGACQNQMQGLQGRSKTSIRSMSGVYYTQRVFIVLYMPRSLSPMFFIVRCLPSTKCLYAYSS